LLAGDLSPIPSRKAIGKLKIVVTVAQGETISSYSGLQKMGWWTTCVPAGRPERRPAFQSRAMATTKHKGCNPLSCPKGYRTLRIVAATA